MQSTIKIQKRKQPLQPRLSSIDVHVGNRLKRRRTALGLSQDALGKAIGLTFQQIQKYERGTNSISPTRFIALQNVLKVPITYFFDELLSDEIDRAIPPIEITELEEIELRFRERETTKLVRLYNQLANENIRRTTLYLVRALVVLETRISRSDPNKANSVKPSVSVLQQALDAVEAAGAPNDSETRSNKVQSRKFTSSRRQ